MASDPRKEHKSVDLIWYQEDFRRYVHGGYHPVSLMDTLHNGRYVIRHKLGWGGAAMVWLARDLHKHRWVAIKIIHADSSNATNEKEMLSRVSPNDPSTSHHSFIVRLLDDFSHNGPNGDHICLVFDLLGPSLHQIIEVCREAGEIEEVEYHEFLKPKVIMKVARQLLTVIAELHEAGFIHGDITPKNIAFTTHRMSKLAEHEFFKIIGNPRIETISRKDGKPIHKGIPPQLVNAITWSEWGDEEHEDIRLIDFGCTFSQSNSEPQTIRQPSQFRAPETFLMEQLDFRSELWSVGVVLYSLMFSFTSFYFGGDVATAIAQMVAFVGDFPAEWQLDYDKLENRDAMRRHHRATPQIDVELKYIPSKRTLKPLFPVLRGLLKMRPSERMTAREALELISTKPRKNHDSHAVVNDHPRRQGLRKRDPKA